MSIKTLALMHHGARPGANPFGEKKNWVKSSSRAFILCSTMAELEAGYTIDP